jgi:hypothetical protein
MTIVNDDSRVVNMLEASLTDDDRVVIYDCKLFIVQTPDDVIQGEQVSLAKMMSPRGKLAAPPGACTIKLSTAVIYEFLY